MGDSTRLFSVELTSRGKLQFWFDIHDKTASWLQGHIFWISVVNTLVYPSLMKRYPRLRMYISWNAACYSFKCAPRLVIYESVSIWSTYCSHAINFLGQVHFNTEHANFFVSCLLRAFARCVILSSHLCNYFKTDLLLFILPCHWFCLQWYLKCKNV